MTQADNPQAEIPLAATVVLLHDGEQGLQVLMLRRRNDLAFYGGAWVFPGGRIETTDYVDNDVHAAARRAATREVHEEAGLRIQPVELCHFAQWITPPGRTRRYDTYFFVARLPDLNIALDTREVDDFGLFTPKEALEARSRGELALPPPTFVTLATLSDLTNTETALAKLGAQPPQHFAPRLVNTEGGAIHLYEPDSGYHPRDPNAPGARHRLVVSGNEWCYERS